MNRRNFVNGSLASAVAAFIPGQQSFASLFTALTTITSSIPAITGDGGEVELEEAALKELQESLRGNLLLSGSEAYEKARRVLNPSIDKHPALVVQPTGAADIGSRGRWHDIRWPSRNR